MNQQTPLIQATLSAVTAALLMAAGPAHAAPQEIVKLPRVVITGKAAAPVATVSYLPRVIVTGISVQTQMKRQMLADAANATAATHRTGSKLLASAL